MCDNCPFAEDGAGLQLRLSLARGRWKEITEGLLHGQHFLCHKTTIPDEDKEVDDNPGYPHGQICAGARHWQSERGIVSDAEQIMERLLKIKQGGG